MRWRLLAFFAVVYLFTAKGYIEVLDTSYSVATAEAIVTRGALDIDMADGTLKAKDGRAYSKYGVGLAFTYVPVVAAAHLGARVTHLPEEPLAGFLISFVNVPFALLLLWTFMRLLARWGIDEAYATLLTLALGLGTLAWRYAGYDFSEEMQAAFALIAYDGITRRDRRGDVIGGFAYAGLLLVKVVHAALFPLFAAYVVFRAREPLAKRARDLVAFGLPIAGAALVLLVTNAVRFGNPLESGYGSEAGKFYLAQLAWTLPALTVTIQKGLFIFCPVLVLGLLGWRPFFRRHAPEAALAAALIVVNLLLAGAWHSWTGGWSWGARLLVPVLPLWLLPAAFWLQAERSKRRFAIAAAVTALSIVVQIPGVLVKEQEIHHISENMLLPDERGAATGEWGSAWVLLDHKLHGAPEIYSPRDFGVAVDRRIDLTSSRTFQGLDLWTEQTARILAKPKIRWLAPLFVLCALVLLAQVSRDLWRRVQSWGNGSGPGAHDAGEGALA